MTFYDPWAFGFAGLVPVIVALYLLKVRRRPVAISTLMFWQRVLQENQRRALFQRLRQWLSLLLHLLIFALVLLALARPTIDRAVHEGSSTVLILDNRARMQAVEPDGETRFTKAQRAALAFARQAGPSRQIAAESASGAGGFPLGFTGDETSLAKCLRAISPTEGGGDLQAAVRLAQDLLAAHAGEKRIVIFSDRTEPGVKAEFVAVGTPLDNVAITHFAARTLLSSPETADVFLEVANFSHSAWSGRVNIAEDGRTLDVRPFALAAGEKKATVFSHVVGERGGRLSATLDQADALALDNTATTVLNESPPRRVLLVTKGNWFLEKVLAADGHLKYELLTPESYRPEFARNFDAVILDDLPPGAANGGNLLYLRQSPFSRPGPEIMQPVITEAETQHPALRLVNLDAVSFARALPMERPIDADGWKYEAPLRFADQPLLVTGERRTATGTGRVAAFGFGVTDSNLPLRVAFPLLISSTLQWLAGDKARETPVETAGQVTRDERESDLRLADGAATVAPNSAPPLTLSLGGWPLWPWLAAAAGLLLCGEWWLFHRRSTE